MKSDFKALVEEFFDFIDPMRGDYIVNTIERWKSLAEFSHVPRIDLQYVREAYRHVQERLQTFNGNAAEFCRLVSEFEAALKSTADSQSRAETRS